MSEDESLDRILDKWLLEKDLDLMHAAIGLLHYEQCGDVNFQEVDKELNDFEKRMANS